jgi:hypothetical protein
MVTLCDISVHCFGGARPGFAEVAAPAFLGLREVWVLAGGLTTADCAPTLAFLPLAGGSAGWLLVGGECGSDCRGWRVHRIGSFSVAVLPKSAIG